ncbi:IS21 family transposase [Candidatus Omnitrophota bacterium]
MLGVAMYTTIATLMEKGLNKSQIARATGHDWKTIAKVIRNIGSGKEAPDKKPHPCILDPHKENIVRLMEEGLSAVRIHQKLTEAGVSAAYPTVKRYVGNIKKRNSIFIRIHTPPGQEAQVDFGYVGLTTDNASKKRKTWVFNMKLSYSRLDYYQKVYDQRVETFIECHINAFNYFGGIPEYVRIDNLKAAILEANFYEPIYQKLYKNFADHYGFKPLPCRIYSPNDKGKVESGIGYAKGNFFAGRTFKGGNDLDKRLADWQENTCNIRVHGTTRKIPKEVFLTEEKQKLRPLPLDEFKMAQAGSRKVYHDCHIYVDYNYYSLPFEYVGKVVDIELTKTLLRVYYKAKEITMHSRQQGRGNFSTNESHYPKYKRFSETEYQERYQVKMATVGPYAEQMFFAIIQAYPKAWARSIQGILSLLKSYPAEIINSACKRALAFGVYQYQVIRNICNNASYLLPLESNWQEPTNKACIRLKEISA